MLTDFVAFAPFISIIDSASFRVIVSKLPVKTKIFPDIIHNYLKLQLANKRQGNHKTKGRSEVKGRSKKPFGQKGTGNARQGSSKPPHFRGGGIAFGPVVRDHSFKLNKKERKLAIRCTLSEKLKNKIVTQIIQYSEFYRAEEYHQNYLNKNNISSCGL